jgi:hypothetical protein
MALRHEAAQLLGFANASEESLATKMADARSTPRTGHRLPAADRCGQLLDGSGGIGAQ